MSGIQHNRVKDPNWPEANQLAIYTEAWSNFNWEQIQLAVRAGLELGASELQVQRSNHSATLPLLEHKENIKVLYVLLFGLILCPKT